jgi:hypothetical protein
MACWGDPSALLPDIAEKTAIVQPILNRDSGSA